MPPKDNPMFVLVYMLEAVKIPMHVQEMALYECSCVAMVKAVHRPGSRRQTWCGVGGGVQCGFLGFSLVQVWVSPPHPAWVLWGTVHPWPGRAAAAVLTSPALQVCSLR